MSVSWRHAARAGALVAASIGALALLPTVLRAPEPPPLDPDVGLEVADVATLPAEPPEMGRDDRGARDTGQRRGDREPSAKRRERRGGGERDTGGRPGHAEPDPPEPSESPANPPAAEPVAPASVPAPGPPPAASAPAPAPPPEPDPPPAPEPSPAPPPPTHSPGIKQFGP